MAYVTKYRIAFTNEQDEVVEVLLQQKNGSAGDVQDYAATSLVIKNNSQQQGKYDCIVSRELQVKFDMRESDIDYWNDFVNAEYDEWLCVATLQGQYIFHGYVLPDDGRVPFQDRPYDATITALDGLGLLKGKPLVQPDGTPFSSENLIIEYIAAALQQTGLQLPIRVYDNVYHRSMWNRDHNYKWDLVGQAKLEYRTFLKDAIEFVDCYEALRIILTRVYRLFYWNGEWVIIRMALYQDVPYVGYYTLYDYKGANAVGYEVTENYATVGKKELIYPCHEDQLKRTTFAVKSVKTRFEYKVWPELPKNNKFERGEVFAQGTAYDSEDFDGDGNTSEVVGVYKHYNIDNWTFGKYTGSSGSLPNLQPTGAKAYRQSIFSIYNVELQRTVVLEGPSPANPGLRNMLVSEGIPVIKGDKMSLSFDYRVDFSSSTATMQIASVFIIPDGGGAKKYISNTGTPVGNQSGPFTWVEDSALEMISVYFGPQENINQWTSFHIEPNEIPVNGTLYICLSTIDLNRRFFFKDFQFTYRPYTAGGYLEVKGDYWMRSQDKNFPDKIEEQIYLSDNPHKVFAGCILDNSGLPTTPDWYRYGISESRHYTELANIAEYNHNYRRFWEIEGTFTGLRWAAQNQQEAYFPIGLHKNYRFVDIAGEDRQFMIASPYSQDMITAETKVQFLEVLKAGTTTTQQPESFNQFRSRIIGMINSKEWPGATTPIYTYAYPDDDVLIGAPRIIAVIMNAEDEMEVSGAGLSIIQNVIAADGTRRMMLQFADVPEVGEIFTFSAYGDSVEVTFSNITITDQEDGRMLGNSSEYKYEFK